MSSLTELCKAKKKIQLVYEVVNCDWYTTFGTMGTTIGANLIKNAILKALSPSLSHGKSSHERILTVSTTGLGDTLWATPAIRALKTSFPNSHLAILTSPIGSQVLKNNPHIDEILIAKDPILPQSLSLIRLMRKESFDTIVVFHTSQRPVLPLCRFAKPKMLIGTKGINKGLDALLTHGIELTYEHEISRRLRLVKTIDANTDSETLDWFVSPEENLLAKAYLTEYKKPVIALHPGAKDQFKQWPKEHFIRLGNDLAATGVQILVTGNKEEQDLTRFIAHHISGAKAVSLPLRLFAAVLAKCKLFITNDTGPMHMAFALGTKTVAFFGPTDPKLCGPHEAKNCLVFSKSRTCNPCLKKSCLDPFCMRQIGPEQVSADVKQFYIGESACL